MYSRRSLRVSKTITERIFLDIISVTIRCHGHVLVKSWDIKEMNSSI